MNKWVLREQRPDILPYDYETPLEREIWKNFLKNKQKNQNRKKK